MLLVHSYIYYELNDSLISDHQWQDAADELVRLQRIHPRIDDGWDLDFADWDGSTGYQLPKSAWVADKAAYLLRICRKPVQPLVRRRQLSML